MLKTLITVASLISLPVTASAEIYKCRLPNGSTEISNVPCPSGSGTITVRPDEHISEASRRQAEQDVERMRSYVEKREAVQRAEEKTEREQAASERQRNTPSRPPTSYGTADECLRDVAQMTLEVSQRAQMEADCRSLVKPQTIYVPVVVPPYHRPRPVTPEPQPKPVPPAAPQISAPSLKK